jgi:aquaporin-7
MEETSFVHSGDIFSLTDKSGYQIPYYNSKTAGNNVGHRRRMPRSYSAHSVLHETNRSQIWVQGSSREHIPFITKSVHMRECLAEFLGTLVFLCFGIGVNNQVNLSDEANGSWLSVNICWGIGVLIGVYVAEGISGAHLNTAVTFTHAVFGRLPWWKVPGYALAQTLGAFCASGLVFVFHYQRLMEADPKSELTQGNFATYPSDNISNLTAFYSEALGTAFLLLAIYAITDERNRGAGPVGTPFAFAMLFMALGMAFGMNTGYALNPARDFGPRLFTLLAGYGTKVFSANSHYFWVPIIGPLVGGVMGAGTYFFIVQLQHDNGDEESESDVL